MDPRTELVDVIRRIRNRWRLRLALRGAVIVVAGTLLALLLSASGLESLRFSAPAIIAFRIVTVAVFVGLLFYGLIVAAAPAGHRRTGGAVPRGARPVARGGHPQRGRSDRRRSDRRVALAAPRREAGRAGHRAVPRRSTTARPSSARRLRRHAVALAAIAAIAALAHHLRPAVPPPRPVGAARHLAQRRSGQPVQHRRACRATPSVPRGGDQAVNAKLVGFTSSDVSVMMRDRPGGRVRARAARRVRRSPAPFEGMLFHLDKPTEYYVESNGVRSRKFMLDGRRSADRGSSSTSNTASPPTRACRRARTTNGGDVAAIRGTDVLLHVTPTMKTPGGTDSVRGRRRAPLTRAGRRHAGRQLHDQEPRASTRSSSTGPHGEKVDASPQYTIDVLDDQPPTVRFNKPGRDTGRARSRRSSPRSRPTTTSASSSCSCSTRSTAAPQKTIKLFGGAQGAAPR